MLRALIFVLVAVWSLNSQPVFAETTASVQSPNPFPTEDLHRLQEAINVDIDQLPGSSGEMRQFIEYRIKNHTAEFHNKLKLLISDSHSDKAALIPLIREHLAFINQIGQYFSDNIELFKAKLGKDNDNNVMVELANRESERDQFFKAKFETLSWLKQLDVDVSDEQTALTNRLLKRADILNSLVLFTQNKLKLAVDNANAAGKNVSSEQTALVSQLKERLALTSASFSVAINLLDKLDQDTAILKQTLFSVSGDITQDVLNIDVAGSLLGQWWDSAVGHAFDSGPNLLFKVFIFLLILFLASLASKATRRIINKTVSTSKLNFSQLLQDFFVSLSGKIIFAVGLMIALSQLGFELGPLLAGFGVAGVIIGFALQDTLSNFASGMMILIYRPYDVGDLINAAGVTGKVSQMSLVSTTIKTTDNQRLIIPNNKIWGDIINNITAEHVRRVDMTFGIGYGDDIPKTEQILTEIVTNHPKVLPSPEPTIRLHNLGESSVDFIVRPWVKPEDYWLVHWEITRAVKMRFDEENITIPFPQRDVHIYRTQAK
ncbi:mechanosensitive ion channel family protein [Shewanella sp. AS1]|uniref:mechanosensitive ion channel family protein n=1 Tax=Shewanella sp. AS1 TaxID=2907626 RepID=UPI001F22AE4C|nr:mechanosensitive ion channel family protein [Shewanella sp. AS1]MCE9679838.1 mechanosensitive ion channel family protein [Shewanella sp. AS1]